jgi:hypothetical protein
MVGFHLHPTPGHVFTYGEFSFPPNNPAMFSFMMDGFRV